MRKLRLLFIVCLSVFSSVDAAVDISMIVIDFKYNGQDGIKVCEVQPLRASRLSGYYYTHPDDSSYAKDSIGAWFDDFEMPKWAERRRLGDPILKNVFQEKFQLFQDPSVFFTSDPDVLSHRGVVPSDQNVLNAYTGMVYLTAGSLKSISHLRSSFPSLIFIDEAINPLYGDKLQVNEVFASSEDLERFRPKSSLYKKKYYSGLANKILSDLGSKRVVIKPRKAAKGYGVIIVDGKDLDHTLKFILNKSDELKNHKDHSYSYWSRDSCPDFIVEEFISSDPVSLDGKWYDPTYRFIVILYAENGIPAMEFIDGYAKLPAKHVHSKGSLNDIYKSCGKTPYFARIEDEDYPVFIEQLQTCLTLFYKELL